MNHHKISLYLILVVFALLGLPLPAAAFDTQVYTASSVLSEGTWMKVAVQADGMYLIPNATLRSWGFSDPQRVRVVGYGGRRISDVLSAANYVDDLPAAPSAVTPKGVVFYALGPGEWTSDAGKECYHYVPNDYTNYAYYFVGYADEATHPSLDSTGTMNAPEGQEVATTFNDYVHHAAETTSPGEAGPLLVGEEFRYTRTRNLTLRLTDAVVVDGLVDVGLHTSFVSRIVSGTGRFNVTLNNAEAPSLSLPSSGSSSYVHGVLSQQNAQLEVPVGTDGSVKVGMAMTATGNVRGAWLHAISLTYPRYLRLGSAGYLRFDSPARALRLADAAEGITVWDVTDPRNPLQVNASVAGGEARWGVTGDGRRSYVAWNPNASIPSPSLVGKIDNQNLHAPADLEMVIIAPKAYMSESERIAAIHREEGMSVAVVDVEKVYNEFSSGAPDVGGIRRYLKMLYDRGNESGHSLRYAILVGRTSFDMRDRTTGGQRDYPLIPAWMPAAPSASLSDNTGYSSDDIAAMLEDGGGADLRRDKLSIAIGRIPATAEDELRLMVDKLVDYARGARKSAWKHRFLFIADDEDQNVHLNQTESMIDEIMSTDRHQHLVRKVYIDAYERQGKDVPGARSQMYRYLDEGVVWWNFVGHANPTSWTGEGILTYSDLNKLFLRHIPFIYAATCDFLRLDAATISGAELLYKERYGGAIGIISAVRPVFISDNGNLTRAIGRALAQRDENGCLLTPGEIYRRAKNDIRSDKGSILPDDNRLRYVFIGDPALKLATPSNIVRLDAIRGEAVTADQAPTIAALEQPLLSGSVTDPMGNILSDFNGTVMIEIFDAECSVTTKGYGTDTERTTFEDLGERLYCGSAKVENGKFELRIAMPSEVAQNYRPAAMSLFAFASDRNEEAVGLCRDFFIFGTDPDAQEDKQRPVIESMILNHSSFRPGDTVNDSPMLIATVSDNVGMNLSSAGIGHQMTAILDGTTTFTDLSQFYTPNSDGTPGGVINYTLENLPAGYHTLALRVWDTSGNSAVETIDFNVAENVAPKIYDVYSDANPASTAANFYLSHDQPDAMATVTVTVYNLLGRPVWNGTVTARSEMFLTTPVTWDLTDYSGRRVPRGIYLYTATISCDGNAHQTATRRIAVTAQ